MNKYILDKLSVLQKANLETISRINNALIEVNGRKNLPLWLEQAFNGSLDSISADALQGLKVGLFYANQEIQRILEKDNG